MRLAISSMVLGALISACCFGGAGSGGGGGGSAPFASAPAVPAGPAVEVNACVVQDAYQANEIAAQQQYPRGTHMIVSGVVDNVAQTFGQMVVHPQRCMFAMVQLANDQTSAAAALRPGQPFRADCTMGNFVLGASFDGCRLLP